MRRVTVCLALMLGVCTARGDVVLDFESLPDGTSVTTQFTDMIFSNATVVTAGISVNEFDFPPHSGSNVVFDDGGPMSISFLGPVDAFGGYFTYTESLTLEAFDASHNLLDVVRSAFSNNTGMMGDPQSSPNEFLEVSAQSLIAEVVIMGDPLGSSFTLDDATVTAPVTSVPEPALSGPLWIMLASLLLLFRQRRPVPSRAHCNGIEGGMQ